MNKQIQKGDGVAWKWGNGVASGTVAEVCPERTQIVSKDKLITRNGTPDNPAVIIIQDNGTEVLKLVSELQ
jgi:hypothetical protein